MVHVPKVIYIETINKCNANCIMCPNSKMCRKKIVMSDDLFAAAVKKCAEMNPVGTQIFFTKKVSRCSTEKLPRGLLLPKNF